MNFESSEEFIRERKKKEKQWYEKYGEREKVYISFVDEQLKNGTLESREQLLQLFRDKQFIENYKSRNDIAYMIVIMKIYEVEISNHNQKTILDMGNSMKVLREKYNELKFILWRIGFREEESTVQRLVDFIRINHVSQDMIRQVINSSVSEKSVLLIKLTEIFLDNSMLSYAFCMLDFMNELSPGDETVLCMLAELCGSVGNIQRMNEYLDRIEKPGRLAEGIRIKYGC